VRSDERIEQLFEAMNLTLQQDTACRGARLRCRTYAIVPLAPTLGLIEWVPHTTVLKHVLRKGLEAHRKAEQAAVASAAAAAAAAAASAGGSGSSSSTGDLLFPSVGGRGSRRGPATAAEGEGVSVGLVGGLVGWMGGCGKFGVLLDRRLTIAITTPQLQDLLERLADQYFQVRLEYGGGGRLHKQTIYSIPL
jgi:hypothetical protein